MFITNNQKYLAQKVKPHKEQIKYSKNETVFLSKFWKFINVRKKVILEVFVILKNYMHKICFQGSLAEVMDM